MSSLARTVWSSINASAGSTFATTPEGTTLVIGLPLE
jgi:hypothetical protein